MQLAYIIPADAAEISSNGKVSILGGEVSEITAPSYPAVGIRLAFVVKLLFERGEIGTTHTVLCDILDSEQIALLPQIKIDVIPQDNGDAQIPFVVVLNLPVLIFPIPGTYLCRFSLGNTLLQAIPLHLKVQSTLENTAVER